MFIEPEVPPVHVGEPVEIDPVTGEPKNSVNPNPSTGTDPVPEPPVHIGEGSGSTGGNKNTVLTFDQYRVKGETTNTVLTTAIRDGTADATKRPLKGFADRNTGTYADINDGYSSPIDREQKNLNDLKSAYEAVKAIDPTAGFTTTTKYDRVTIRSLVDERSSNIVNEGGYNREKGAIVALWNFQENDLWPRSDPHRLTWSELTWQTWKKVSGPQRGDLVDRASGLKYIFRRDVQNEGTSSVVQKAHETNGLSMDGRGEFEVDNTNKAKSDAFYALLGTDNVKGVAFMLKDHHNELGGKVIKKIITIPKGSLGSENKLSLVIVLGT